MNVLIQPVSGSIYFDNNPAGSSTTIPGNVTLSYNTSGALTISSNASASTLRFAVSGGQGGLFSVYDSLTGQIFAVNKLGGIPVLEAYDNDTVKLGTYLSNTLLVSGTQVSMGGLPLSAAVPNKLSVIGNTSITGSLNVGTNNTVVNSSNVLGGACNTVSGLYSTIVGGFSSCNVTNHSTIGGGSCNVIGTGTGGCGTIAGGGCNKIQTSAAATIGGGVLNTASGYAAVVAGGAVNTASGARSTVSGGYLNSSAAFRSFVGAGGCNCVSTTGSFSVVVGGFKNTASGVYSIIGGGYGNFTPTRDSQIVGGVVNHTGGAVPFNITAAASISGNGTQTCLIGTGIQSCVSYPFTTNNISVYYATASNPLSSGTFATATVAATGTNYIIINNDYSTCTPSGLSATSIYIFDRAINTSGYDNFIGGGKLNTASGNYNTIGGGFCNVALCNGGVVVGGYNNTVAFANCGSVVGGISNAVYGALGFIGGGGYNGVNSTNSVVVGGQVNNVACNFTAVVGGLNNSVCGPMGIIGGGMNNHIGGYTPVALAQSALSGNGAGCTSFNVGALSACFTTIANCNVSISWTTLAAPASAGAQLSNSGKIVSNSGGCLILNTTGFLGNSDFSTCNGALSISATCVYLTDKTLNLTGHYSNVIGGGYINTASGLYSSVLGGKVNTASSYGSTVGGGLCNIATGGIAGVIVGGSVNSGQCNAACGGRSVVAGGFVNTASGTSSTVAGGQGNIASGACSSATGGVNNRALAGSSFIVGGNCNTVSGLYSNIGGGLGNYNPLRDSQIVGGVANHTGGCTPLNFVTGLALSGNGTQSCICGVGIQSCFSSPFTSNNISVYYATASNPLSSGTFATATVAATGTNYVILGTDFSACSTGLSATNLYIYDRAINTTGYGNFIGGGKLNTASSCYSTVGGGKFNTASGYGSFLGGGCSNKAVAIYSGLVGGMGNCAGCSFSFIGGGAYNAALGGNAVIAGGGANVVSSGYSSLIGGQNNLIPSNVKDSVISGGVLNHLGGYTPIAVAQSALSGNGVPGSVCTSINVGTLSAFFGSAGSTINWLAATPSFPLSGNNTNAANILSNSGGFLTILINGSNDFSTCGSTSVSATCVYLYDKTINNTGYANFIGGGRLNTASGCYSTLGAGAVNTASGNYSSALGGSKNTASGFSSVAVGGRNNSVPGDTAVVVGGNSNNASGCRSFVGSGIYNCTPGNHSVVVGGCVNTASGCYSVVAGGCSNIASGAYSFVAGGSANDTKGFTNTFILGTGLNATATNYTYVNNISSQGAATVGGIITSNYSGASDSSVLLLGGNTKGGAGYNDFLRVYNPTGANSLWFRTNNAGGLELISSDYTKNLFSVSQYGNVNIYGNNAAVSTNYDGVSGTLQFNNNNSQIYDDGNFHIHSRGSGQSVWINSNSGDIRFGQQIPIAGGAVTNSIIFGGPSNSTATGYVNVLGSKTYNIPGPYGYLNNTGAGSINSGGQTGSVAFSIYSAGRIQSAEVDVTSDERVKNVEGTIPLEDAIKFIKNVDGIKYTWKEGFGDEGIKTGFGAQSVHKAGFEHMVSYIANDKVAGKTDKDGWIHPDKTQLTMGYNQAIPYHHEVIKNLLGRIEELEATIAELKR